MIDEYMKHLYDYLTHEIAKRNVSITAFADLCGVSRNEMSKILNGKKKDIHMSTLLKIADELDVPVQALIIPGKAVQRDYNAEFIERIYSEIKWHMRKINAA